MPVTQRSRMVQATITYQILKEAAGLRRGIDVQTGRCPRCEQSRNSRAHKARCLRPVVLEPKPLDELRAQRRAN